MNTFTLLVSLTLFANPEENAKNFSAEGVTFSLTKEDFLKKHPKAQLKEKRIAKGKTLSTYRILAKQPASVVDVIFVNSTVGYISIGYTIQSIDAKYGSADGFIETVNKLFGESSYYKEFTEEDMSSRLVAWYIKKENKIASLHILKNVIILSVKDITILED